MTNVLMCRFCGTTQEYQGYMKPAGWISLSVNDCGVPREEARRRSYHVCPKCKTERGL